MVVDLASPEVRRKGIAHANGSSRWHRLRESLTDAPAEIPALDGLRGVAILLVMLQHYGPPPPIPILHQISQFGWAGVELFFVLSGFLLFLPYSRAMIKGTPWPSTRRFYLRRARRILPAFLAFLAVVGTPLVVYGLVPARAILLTPLLMYNMDAPTWRFVWAFNGPLWTLAIECQFYLALPWIALVIARVGRSNMLRVWLGLALLCAASFALRGVAAWLHYEMGYSYPAEAPGFTGLLVRLLYGIKGRYLDSFAIGMALAVIYVRWIDGIQWPCGRRRRLTLWAMLLGYCLLVYAHIWSLLAGRFVYVDSWVWPPVGRGVTGAAWALLGEWVVTMGFGLVTLAALLRGGTVARILANRPLRFIGVISYSTYLWHLWLFGIVPHQLPITVGTVLMVSVGSYYLIERPFLQHRAAKRDTNTPHNCAVAEPAGKRATSRRRIMPFAYPTASQGTGARTGTGNR